MKMMTPRELKENPEQLYDMLRREGEVMLLASDGSWLPIRLEKEKIPKNGGSKIASAFFRMADTIPEGKGAEVVEAGLKALEEYREEQKSKK